MNPLIQALAGPVIGLLKKRTERKAALDSMKGQAELAKQNGDQEISIKRADWELVGKKAESDTWKDEYAVLIVTCPIIVMFIGALLAPFGITSMLEAGQQMIDTFSDNGIDYGLLLYITIGAALGIRVMKP